MNTLLLSTIISIGAITAIVLVIIYSTSSQNDFSSQDSRYSQFAVLVPYASMAKTVDISTKTCFDVTDSTLNEFPIEFRYYLQNASRASENVVYFGDPWGSGGFPDNFLPPHRKPYSLFGFPNNEIIKLLEEYNFTENRGKEMYLGKFTAEWFAYKCLFNYHEKQYVVWFNFKVPSVDTVKHFYVNFTKNGSGDTIISNQTAIIKSPYSRHMWIIFNNQLDHEVNLRFSDMPSTYYNFYVAHDFKIPPGQTILYPVSDIINGWPFSVERNLTFHYIIEPDYVNGAIYFENIYWSL